MEEDAYMGCRIPQSETVVANIWQVSLPRVDEVPNI